MEKKSLMNQQHYYRSSVLPSLSALCGRASLHYISVIHDVDTIHQSTPFPPLSIFCSTLQPKQFLAYAQKCVHIHILHCQELL